MADDKKVVTNIRMSRDEWIQAKTRAAELGVSLNEYFVNLSKKEIKRVAMGDKKVSEKKKKSLSDLVSHATEFKSWEEADVSEDDKAIYGT